MWPIPCWPFPIIIIIRSSITISPSPRTVWSSAAGSGLPLKTWPHSYIQYCHWIKFHSVLQSHHLRTKSLQDLDSTSKCINFISHSNPPQENHPQKPPRHSSSYPYTAQQSNWGVPVPTSWTQVYIFCRYLETPSPASSIGSPIIPESWHSPRVVASSSSSPFQELYSWGTYQRNNPGLQQSDIEHV